jgi:hypothetical protein
MGTIMGMGSPYWPAMIQPETVIYASGGWSHGFLVEKHHCLWPDVEADRLRAEQIRDGREGEWKELTVAQIEDAGQQELMTWICVGRGRCTSWGRRAR